MIRFNDQKISKFTRVLVNFLCFLVVPLFLLNLTLESYFEQKERKITEKLRSGIDRTLTRLKNHADGSRYFDRVLKQSFESIASSEKKSVTSELSKKIGVLKKKFPDTFEFIVWNSEGDLLKELSDNTDFLFFRKKLNAFLKEIFKLTKESFPDQPHLSSSIKKQIRNFRQLLGPFIPSSALAKAMIPSPIAGCFQMHGHGKRAYGWYRDFEAFSIMAYISHKAVNSMAGAKSMCLRSFKSNRTTKFALLDENSLKTFPSVKSPLQRKIALNLKKSINMTPDEMLFDQNFFYSFRKLHGKWWATAITSRTPKTHTSQKIVYRLAAALLILLFIFHCFFLVHHNPFSLISWKLNFIFVYTVLLPLAIFSVAGYEYFSQKKTRLQTEKTAEILAFLDRYEQNFEIFKDSTGAKLTEIMEKEFWQNEKKDAKKKSLKDFMLKIKIDFNLVGMYIADKTGSTCLPDYQDPATEVTFLKPVSEAILKHLNGDELRAMEAPKILTISAISSFESANTRIRHEIVGQSVYYTYSLAMLDPRTRKFPYLIQLFWDTNRFQNMFHENFNDPKTSLENEVMMFFPETGSYSDGKIPDWRLNDFFSRVSANGNHAELFSDNAEEFLIVGKSCMKIAKAIICTRVKTSSIQNDLRNLENGLLVAISASILFSLGLFILLNQELISPIKILITGVEKIRRSQFSYRMPVNGNNELARLTETFNQTLENLQEFAIAQVVQESLLPEDNRYSAPGFEVFGKSVAMTKLGGDYYEYFITEDGRLIAMIADVAGHGVQAGLFMAMAKSAFNLARHETSDPAGIMARINEAFYKIRRSGIRTMITCSIFCFDLKEGTVDFINAGHCSPFLISPDGKEIENPLQETFPLGYSKTRDFEVTRLNFDVGSTLMMFTDGIFESRNFSNEMLGLDAFMKMIKQSFDHDLEAFYSKIFSHYENWRHEQDDDITMVMVRRKNSNEIS
ncbi:MAG: PP2C family protein-serine/threonine phosphatase [Candidatus Rifleibacteriota bacterium]